MQFQVPQFIEIEDKVIGPLTFKQFIYLAGGGGLSFLLYTLLPILIAIPLIAAVVGISIAFAFYKVNNKPFVHIVESFVRYTMGGKLYIWKKLPKKKEEQEKKETENEDVLGLSVPRMSESKLKDLAWSLDIEHK